VCFQFTRLNAGATAIWTVGRPGRVNPNSEVPNGAEEGGSNSRQPLESGPHWSRFHGHTIPHSYDERMPKGIYGTSSAGLLYPLGGSVNSAEGPRYPHSTRSSALLSG